MSKVIKLGRDGVGLNALEKCSVVPPEAILSGFADELGDVHFESPDKAVVIGTWQSREHWARWHDDEAFKATRAELAGLEDGPSTTVWYDVVEEQG